MPIRLKRLREERGLSQQAVSLLAELTPARLSEYERGARTPRGEVLDVLGTILGFDPVDFKRRTAWEEPSTGRPQRGGERALLARFSPDLHALYHPPRRKDFAFHMAGVRDRFGEVLKVLGPRLDARPDRREAERFLRDFPADSADEAVLALHLAASCPRRARASPASLGFFAHAVIDPDRRVVVGHRRRLAFGTEFQGAVFAFLPQVAVRPEETIIMDLLAGVREGTTSWIDVEVDGSGHDPLRDKRRAELLGLPVLRLDSSMLFVKDFMPRYLRTLLWIHRNRFRGVVRELEQPG